MIGEYEYLDPGKVSTMLIDWIAWTKQREPGTSTFSCQLRPVGKELLVADVTIGGRIPRRRKVSV